MTTEIKCTRCGEFEPVYGDIIEGVSRSK